MCIIYLLHYNIANCEFKWDNHDMDEPTRLPELEDSF